MLIVNFLYLYNIFICLCMCQVIEMSFEQGTDPNTDSTIEGVLNSVNRMVETLDQVVEDLMPLLPEDFNVITMFQVYPFSWFL
jgi:hypothetical protein